VRDQPLPIDLAGCHQAVRVGDRKDLRSAVSTQSKGTHVKELIGGGENPSRRALKFDRHRGCPKVVVGVGC
jgi:hypothetical protein